MENNINETKVMLEILGELLERYSIEYLMEEVRDVDGFMRPRWMILKERIQ